MVLKLRLDHMYIVQLYTIHMCDNVHKHFFYPKSFCTQVGGIPCAQNFTSLYLSLELALHKKFLFSLGNAKTRNRFKFLKS